MAQKLVVAALGCCSVGLGLTYVYLRRWRREARGLTSTGRTPPIQDSERDKRIEDEDAKNDVTAETDVIPEPSVIKLIDVIADPSTIQESDVIADPNIIEVIGVIVEPDAITENYSAAENDVIVANDICEANHNGGVFSDVIESRDDVRDSTDPRYDAFRFSDEQPEQSEHCFEKFYDVPDSDNLNYIDDREYCEEVQCKIKNTVQYDDDVVISTGASECDDVTHSNELNDIQSIDSTDEKGWIPFVDSSRSIPISFTNKHDWLAYGEGSQNNYLQSCDIGVPRHKNTPYSYVLDDTLHCDRQSSSTSSSVWSRDRDNVTTSDVIVTQSPRPTAEPTAVIESSNVGTRSRLAAKRQDNVKLALANRGRLKSDPQTVSSDNIFDDVRNSSISDHSQARSYSSLLANQHRASIFELANQEQTKPLSVARDQLPSPMPWRSSMADKPPVIPSRTQTVSRNTLSQLTGSLELVDKSAVESSSPVRRGVEYSTPQLSRRQSVRHRERRERNHSVSDNVETTTTWTGVESFANSAAQQASEKIPRWTSSAESVSNTASTKSSIGYAQKREFLSKTLSREFPTSSMDNLTSNILRNFPKLSRTSSADISASSTDDLTSNILGNFPTSNYISSGDSDGSFVQCNATENENAKSRYLRDCARNATVGPGLELPQDSPKIKTQELVKQVARNTVTSHSGITATGFPYHPVGSHRESKAILKSERFFDRASNGPSTLEISEQKLIDAQSRIPQNLHSKNEAGELEFISGKTKALHSEDFRPWWMSEGKDEGQQTEVTACDSRHEVTNKPDSYYAPSTKLEGKKTRSIFSAELRSHIRDPFRELTPDLIAAESSQTLPTPPTTPGVEIKPDLLSEALRRRRSLIPDPSSTRRQRSQVSEDKLCITPVESTWQSFPLQHRHSGEICKDEAVLKFQREGSSRAISHRHFDAESEDAANVRNALACDVTRQQNRDVRHFREHDITQGRQGDIDRSCEADASDWLRRDDVTDFPTSDATNHHSSDVTKFRVNHTTNSHTGTESRYDSMYNFCSDPRAAKQHDDDVTPRQSICLSGRDVTLRRSLSEASQSEERPVDYSVIIAVTTASLDRVAAVGAGTGGGEGAAALASSLQILTRLASRPDLVPHLLAARAPACLLSLLDPTVRDTETLFTALTLISHLLRPGLATNLARPPGTGRGHESSVYAALCGAAQRARLHAALQRLCNYDNDTVSRLARDALNCLLA